MTSEEVHRVLYGNEQDVDTVIPDQGFLGMLRSNLLSAQERMAIVLSDVSDDKKDHTSITKFNYSCVLPYYFINQLYMYYSSDNPIDLAKQRVEEAFEDTVIIPSNDYSTFFIGTFYEWLVKVARYSDIYIGNQDTGAWETVRTQPRLNNSCGYYEGDLFFDSLYWWIDKSFENFAVVFAPIVGDNFNGEPINPVEEETSPMFYLDVHYPVYFNPNQFCSGQNQGVDAYEVETTLPEDVLGPLAAISFYEFIIIMKDWQELYNAVAGGEPLTAEQKADIQVEAEKRGVHINKRCSSCYRDALIQFITQDRKTKQDADERRNNLRHWVLRKGLDVIFRGVRVNEATLTDALALRLHRAGFPNHLLWPRIPTKEELKERDERFRRSLSARYEDETPEQRGERLKRQEEVRKAMHERKAVRLSEIKVKRAAEAASEAQSVETQTETETDEAKD